MASEKLIKDDMQFLMEREEFRRFMWRAIQLADIFSPTTNGSVDRSLDYFEGRRNLGLELLSMAELGQPAAHPDHIPIFTLMQVLREEAQGSPTEKPNDKYDRNAELSDEDDAE